MASSTHHQSAQHSRYPLSIPPNRDEAVRLPSIKDLNFQYSRARHASQDTPHNLTQTIAPVDTLHSQENTVRWSRSNVQPQSPSPMPVHLQQQHHHQQQQQQHTPPLSAGHDQPKTDYSSKPDNGGFLTPGMPLSAQSTPVPGSVTIGPGTRGDEPPQSKRRRSSGTMGAPRDARSPHTSYATHYAGYPPSQPPPQQSYHQMQAPMTHPGQPPLEHVHAQQVAVPAQPSYAGYPPQQYMAAPRVHPHPPAHQQAPPSNPYPSPAPAPQGPWEQTPHHPQPHQHHHQPPPPHHPHQSQPTSQLPPPQHTHVMTQHQQTMPPPSQHHIHSQHHQPHQAQQVIPPPLPPHLAPQSQPQPPPHQAPPQMQSQIQFQRTTAIVPIDTRGPYPVGEQERMPSAGDNTMSEIIKHCSALYNFASRYAQIQQSVPDVCPSPEELQEMSQRAVEVVRLLEEYRRISLPESERVKMDNAAAITPPDDHRPPKRPWEDMSHDENVTAAESSSFTEPYPTPIDKAQTTAEQDMEIIRTKRATSTAGASGSAGQPKSKYRKRSRATPPGKCHSCNIRETPEWRRGPDGARTLCNACGLHYAKLQRKRDKMAGPDGEAPRIDMETLRASARAADVADKSHSRPKHSSRSQQSAPTSPMETGKPLPQQHHQGSFQLVTMMPPEPSSATDPARVAQQQPSPHGMQQQPGPMAAPTPPWTASVQSSGPASRAYAPEQLQHQSFIRTSHQPTNRTTPR